MDYGIFTTIQMTFMNQIKLIFLSLVILMAASCTSKKSSTAKVRDIKGAGVIQYPVVAEMDVRTEKVTGKVEWKGGGPTINTLKEMAITDAVKKANADLLIEPHFDIEIKGRRKVVSVVGYPAYYTKFRNALPSDTIIAQLGMVQQPKQLEPLPEQGKGKRTVRNVLVGTGSAIGLFIIGLLLFS
jgi:hypothetical protein